MIIAVDNKRENKLDIKLALIEKRSLLVKQQAELDPNTSKPDKKDKQSIVKRSIKSNDGEVTKRANKGGVVTKKTKQSIMKRSMKPNASEIDKEQSCKQA